MIFNSSRERCTIVSYKNMKDMILKGRRNKKEAVEKLTSDNILYVSVVVNNILTDNMTRSHIDTCCLLYICIHAYVYLHTYTQTNVCTFVCVHAQIWVYTYVCECAKLMLVVFFSCPVYQGEISC